MCATQKSSRNSSTLSAVRVAVVSANASRYFILAPVARYYSWSHGKISTPMGSAATPMGFREVLQLKSMRRLWAAQIVSIFGDFLAIFAVFSVLTFRLHG